MRTPLSVNLMPDAPPGQVAELAQLAEQLGFVRCWVYDEGVTTRDVYVTLATIADVTDRILIGPGITNPFVRHPGATASAIATLDELSGGRAFLGLGSGGALTLGPLAVDRARPLAAVRDMTDTLRRLFAGERVTHDGHAFSFADAHLDYARADIEIHLAGRGGGITRYGGEAADGFYLSYIHKDLLGSHTAALRTAAAGRPFTITYSTMVASTDEEIDAIRAQLTFRLVDSPGEVKELLGLDEERAEQIRAAVRSGGPDAAAHLVDPEWVESFAIVGTPDDCASELHRIVHDNDIDEFQIPVQHIDSGAALIERVAALVF